MHRGRREAGVAAVEFALVVPVLFALIVGIVEFGVAINFRTQLNNATAVATRDYAINRNKTTAEAIINGVASGPNVTNESITYAVTGGTGNECNDTNSGKPVTITVTLKRGTLTSMLGSTFSYSAKGVARCN